MQDYSSRRQAPANPNRPAKQGGKVFFVVSTVLASVVVGVVIGAGGGWLMYKPARQEMNKLRHDLDEANARIKELTQAQVRQEPPPSATGTAPNPPLTFYNTLKTGGNVLGTGVNPQKQDQPPARPPVPEVPGKPVKPPAVKMGSASSPSGGEQVERGGHPSPQKGDKPAPPSQVKGATAASLKPDRADKSVESPPTKGTASGKFVVQVASYQSKSEAEAVRSRLSEGGISAYIVESTVKDKGTLYRVRVGKHLEFSAATDLAAKSGRGAIVVLE